MKWNFLPNEMEATTRYNKRQIYSRLHSKATEALFRNGQSEAIHQKKT